MPSSSAESAVSVRVDQDFRDRVHAVLAQEDIQIRQVVVATLTAAASKPAVTQRFFAPYWPAAPRRGRRPAKAPSAPRPSTSITVKQLDPDMLAKVNASLARRDLTLNGLIVAMFTRATTDIASLRDFLAPYLPAPGRRGRPPIQREHGPSPSELRDGATKLLAARGLDLAQFQRAAMAELLTDPDRLLEYLAHHLPEH